MIYKLTVQSLKFDDELLKRFSTLPLALVEILKCCIRPGVLVSQVDFIKSIRNGFQTIIIIVLRTSRLINQYLSHSGNLYHEMNRIRNQPSRYFVFRRPCWGLSPRLAPRQRTQTASGCWASEAVERPQC